MKSTRNIAIVWIVSLLTACQFATPAPITATTGAEFTLAPGQTATLEDIGLTITLVGVSGDERCPSKIECVISGPVSLTVSAQKDSDTPSELNFQTFTSNDGRAPDGQFEGIQNQAEYAGYVIQVKGVLPYPVRVFNEIKDVEYQVTLLVTEK